MLRFPLEKQIVVNLKYKLAMLRECSCEKIPENIIALIRQQSLDFLQPSSIKLNILHHLGTSLSR